MFQNMALNYSTRAFVGQKFPGHSWITSIFVKEALHTFFLYIYHSQGLQAKEKPILQIVQGDMMQILQQLNTYFEENISKILH